MEGNNYDSPKELKREMSIESAAISGIDTVEQYEKMKKKYPDLDKTGGPEEIDPELLEMNVEPDGYDFNERLKQEAPPPSNFLPPNVNREILKKFYIVFKKLYELSNGDLITSFTMTNFIFLGSSFYLNLISHLSKIDASSFLFSQVGITAMVNLYAPDEEYEEFIIRKKLRDELTDKQSSIVGLLKSSPSTGISEKLGGLGITEELAVQIKGFMENFSMRGSVFSENFNSFIENGVVKFMNGSGLYSLLFSHNYRANRSSTDGEPIYKLLDELEESEIQDELKGLIEDEKTKQLMNSLFNIILLFSLLQPELRNVIATSLPKTTSSADIRSSQGISMPRLTYMDRVPSFFNVNTDLFKYIMKKIPTYRRSEFKKILYEFLAEEKTKGDFDELVKEFTGKNIKHHETIFKKMIKKQTRVKKSAYKKGKKKKPVKTEKKKKPSKREILQVRSRKKDRKKDKKKKKKKKKKTTSASRGKNRKVNKDRVIRVGDSVEIRYN